MLFFNYELWVVNYEFTFLWKWEASSKNNALTNLVRWGSSAGKGIVFYLLAWIFVIAFMIADAKIMFRSKFSKFKDICLEGVRHLLSWKQWSLWFLANEKSYSCWPFLILCVPESNYECKIMNYELGCFGIVARTKTMKILPMSAVSW